MGKVYCKNCGIAFPDARTLAINNCSMHPDGTGRGKHQLYEGGEKSSYLCKYCGRSFRDLRTMVINNCTHHPNGTCKGKHSPAL